MPPLPHLTLTLSLTRSLTLTLTLTLTLALTLTSVVSKSKLKIAVVGAGLAGMIAAMDLVDAGHDVELFELRPFVGGKVSLTLTLTPP